MNRKFAAIIARVLPVAVAVTAVATQLQGLTGRKWA